MAKSKIDFDGKQLIREVRKRPLLYDRTASHYSNLAERRKAWIEVCQALVGDWSSLDDMEREGAISQVNKRWQNMRNSFQRELKAQRNSGAGPNSKRRKYFYFDDMLFIVDNSSSNQDKDDQSDDEKSDVDQESQSGEENAWSKKFKYSSCVDTEHFIQVVEAEPILYNLSLKNRPSKNEKTEAWERVCASVYDEKWDQWSDKERTEAVLVLKNRWGSLRNCFLRELKKKERFPRKQMRREYRFFQALKFLTPHTEYKLRAMRSETVEDFEEEQLQEDFDFCADEDSAPTYIGIEQDYSGESNDHMNSFTDSMKSGRKDKVKVEVEKDPLTSTSTENIDQDLNFALSLVPMMRNLTPTRKLEIQIEILRLFKNVSSK